MIRWLRTIRSAAVRPRSVSTGRPLARETSPSDSRRLSVSLAVAATHAEQLGNARRRRRAASDDRAVLADRERQEIERFQVVGGRVRPGGHRVR